MNFLRRLSGWISGSPKTPPQQVSDAAHGATPASGEPRSQTRLSPGFEDLAEPMPAGIHVAPSMISDEERALLYNLVLKRYEGRGLIVDAGIFLGGSTCCFGEALKARGPLEPDGAWSGLPIRSYDLCIANTRMIDFIRRAGLEPPAPDGSLVPLIETQIAGVRHLVDFKEGDITKTGILDEPIEILFLDCLKQEAISLFAVKTYFPLLLPGAFVIQQDYLSEMLPYIKVHQEFFADRFDYVGEVGSSAVYRLREPIPPEEIERCLAGIDPDRQLDLMSIAETRTSDPKRAALISLSRYRLLAQLKGLDAARPYLAQIKQEAAGKALPRRVIQAIEGADYLDRSDGSRAAFIDSQLVSLGHQPPQRPPKPAPKPKPARAHPAAKPKAAKQADA